MRLPALALVALAVAACGTAPKAPPAAKPAYYSDDGPPESIPVDIAAIPDAVPRDEPYLRYANRPYTVFGRSYAPVVNDDPMRERGLASWYGRKFHGQKTSSGEVYDMFAMTAAHKTLPIPSYARVTSVANGRSVVVRVNDRGPFHEGRVIDLSYKLAHENGFKLTLYFLLRGGGDYAKRLHEAMTAYGVDTYRSDFGAPVGPAGMAMLDWLFANHPNFRYEHCNGGGAYKDFATLRRASVVFGIDVYDPLSKRKMWQVNSYCISSI